MSEKCKNCLEEIIQQKDLMGILKWWHKNEGSRVARHSHKTSCGNPKPMEEL